MTPSLAPYKTLILFIFLWATSSQTHLAEANVQLHSSPLSSLIHGKTITAIFTDRSEHLWIGTQAGLYHFDGATVHTYSASEKAEFRMPVSDIRGISEDSNGNLILATYGGGLMAWNDNHGTFKRVKHSLLAGVDYLTGLTRDSNGNFLLHSSSETVIVDSSLSRVHEFTALFPEIPKTDSSTLSLSLPSGSMLVFSAGQLYLANMSFGTSNAISIDVTGYNISLLKRMDDKTALIGTERGELLLIDTESWIVRRENIIDTDKKVTITDAAEYRGDLWIASDNGLHIANSDLEFTRQFSRANSELASNHITTLYKIDNRLLIGTYGGLDQVTPAPFKLMNSKNSNVYNDVMAIEEDQNGSIWIGTFDGVFRYNNSTGKHNRLEASSNINLPDQRAMSIEATSEHIWIGFWKNGIAIIDLESGETIPFPYDELSEISVTKILKFGDNDVWIATYNYGILRVSGKKIFRYPKLSDRSVIALSSSPSGNLYLLSEESVFLYERNSDSFLELRIAYPKSFEDVALLTINTEESHKILIGTKDHGVFELEAKNADGLSFNARPFIYGTGITPSSVYGILSDDDSNFWLSTSIGIIHLAESGRLISRYSETSGIQGNDFSFGAFLKTADGRIFFGGPNGYNIFHPSDVSVQQSQPKLTIPAIKIGSSALFTYANVKNRSEFRLNHNSHSIAITLGLLDFTDPTQNRYTHIMEGLDPDWIDDGTDNTITYTNLQPGEYVFRAKGANSAGIWNEEGVSLRILVLPPWWLTWWAYCLYVVAFLVVIWGAMRIYREHLLKEEAIKNSIEMQDAADRAQDDLQESHEQQDDLVRAVHQHNLATLDLIGKYLEPTGIAELTKPKIRGHLKAMELLEKCYYFQGGMLMADIHTYIDSLTSHLLQVARVDPAKITTINLTASELLPASIASPAAVILYELLENALLHAFTEKQAAHFIEIRGEVDRSAKDRCFLLLSVSDDGVGFPRPESDRSQSKVGLEVVHSLAESLGGRVAISHDHGVQSRVSLPMPD